MANFRVHIEPFEPTKCTWSRWVERLETAFELMEASEASKQKLLMHYMGQETYNVLCDKLAPIKPSEKSYAEIETLMKEHFEPQPLEIVENFKFHLRKQQDNEKVSEFMVALRRLSIHCHFGNYLETALRNQFVFGIRNVKIQNRLLEMKDLTLRRAEEIAVAMELSERGGAEMHPSDIVAVNLIKERTKKRPSGWHKKAERGSSSSDSEGSDRGAKAKGPECYRCGGTSHWANKCHYRKAVCNRCQSIGHLARVCQKASAPSSATNNITTISDLANITEIMCRRASTYMEKIVINVELNNRSVSFELDTGAPVTIMGLGDAKQLFANHRVFPADRRLNSYCGKEIHVFGYVWVKLTNNAMSRRLKLYVVESKRPPLLGREWLAHMHLNWQEVFGNKSVTAIGSLGKVDVSDTKWRNTFKRKIMVRNERNAEWHDKSAKDDSVSETVPQRVKEKGDMNYLWHRRRISTGNSPSSIDRHRTQYRVEKRSAVEVFVK